MAKKAVGIFIVTLAAYFPAIRGGFVWDDDAHVTKPSLQSLHGLGRIWFELGATQQYYPVLHSAFWLEHRLWGDAAMGYHLANIFLHATAACLFGLVLQRLWKVDAAPSPRSDAARAPHLLSPALFGALIFALHPVCVESVAWISEQKNTLSTVFYLLAVLAYLKFSENRPIHSHAKAQRREEVSPNGFLGAFAPLREPGLGWYLLSLTLFILAILSKSVTATLPAALLVIFWWQRGRLSWKRDVLPLLPWFVIGAASGLFSAWVERTYIGARGAAFNLDAAQRCLVAGRAIWFYLGRLLWPANLIFIYPHWQVDASAGWQYLFPLGAAVLAAALWLMRRRTRAPLAALLFFAGSLFPVLGFLNIYPFVFSYVADHFQYLASMGVIALAAAPFRNSKFEIRNLFALALLCILGTLTWRQCRMYRDAETLYRTTLARNPSCWLADLNLGDILWEAGRPDEAVAHYRESLRFNPDYADTHFDLGKVLMQMGRTAEAAAQFSDAIRINPGDAQARNNLGIALVSLGRVTEAVTQFEESLRLQPDNAKAHNNLGVALRALGRDAEAEAEFEQAARLGGGR